jgi:ankyrin repeat protein
MQTKTRAPLGSSAVAFLVVFAGLAAAADESRVADAAKSRNKEALRALLDRRVDVNATLPDGATALHWAAHWGDLDIADLLIHAGAQVNVANDYGVTALSLACTNGDPAMVERLLKAGADPSIGLPSQETPLMTCARSGNRVAVEALLARRVDVNVKETGRGQTPLMWAVAEGHLEIARLLIDHGADIHARSTAGFAPLLFAARRADVSMTRLLLSAGANINQSASDGMTALLTATIKGHTEYAEFLLSQGANPNLGAGFTPLHWAAGEWVNVLSAASTGVTAKDTEWSAVGGLRGERKLAFVKTLLAHGANPNIRAETNPSYSGGRSRGGSLAGGTAFLLAAAASDVNVMRSLVRAGADPHLATNQNTTPLMVAAGLGYDPGQNRRLADDSALEPVKLCWELGGDVNAVNADGETALHGAAYREEADAIIQFLVDKGAKLNVKDRRGWTPLTIAEGIRTLSNYIRSPRTAELLRALGAEPSPPNVERFKPIAELADRVQQGR